MLVQKLILFRIDFCNSLYMNLPQVRLKKLSSIINSCIRFIYGIKDRKKDLRPYYIMAHILPIEHRVSYKVCLMAYKIFYGLAPQYFDNCLEKSVDDTKNTRSNPDYDILKLKVPKFARTKLQSRRFSAHAPELWNNLPYFIRSMDNVDLFKKHLKTHFFRIMQCSANIDEGISQ